MSYQTDFEMEQDEMISNLIFDINSILLLNDYNKVSELVDNVISQTNIYSVYADKYAYNKVITITDEITIRINQIKNIQKQHLIPTRIKDIISTIKW